MIRKMNRSRWALLLGATSLAVACSGKARRSQEEVARGGALPMGAGGKASGGNGGLGGPMSNGGSAAVGETGGSAAVGGAGGSAGACGPQLPPLTFACETPTFTLGASTCGEAATRAALACGMPGSQYDANCCERQRCRNDAECGREALCIPRSLQSPGVGGSETENCELCDGECSCIGTEDIDVGGRCIARSERVADFLCDVAQADCRELHDWAYATFELTSIDNDDVSKGEVSSYASRIVSCRETLLDVLAERCGEQPACTCDAEDEPSCAMKLADFNPFASRIGAPLTLDQIRRGAAVMVAGTGFEVATYSDCDDGTQRFHLANAAIRYNFVFDAARQGLLYGSASGFVGELCDRTQVNGKSSIEAGSPVPAATCRTCSFASERLEVFGEGGAPGDFDPDCVYDSFGRLSMPR